MITHNFRVTIIDICRVYLHVTLPHGNFPFRLLTNRLRGEKIKINLNQLNTVMACMTSVTVRKLIWIRCLMCISAYLSDNIRVRRFVSWNHAAVAVALLANPMNELYYPNHRSTGGFHPDWYQYMMHHLCGLGIVAPALDYVNPKRQCVHRCSMRSILLNLDWLRGHNMQVRMMWARL